MYMKKSKTGSDFLNPRKWRKPFYLLFAATALYLLFLAAALTRNANPDADAGESPPFVDSIPDPKLVKPHISYGRITGELLRRRSRRFTWSGNLSMLETAANNAWSLGAKAWREIENNDFQEIGREERSCPSSVSENFENKSVEMEEMVVLPCGLEVGSSITVIGKPERGRREYVPEVVKRGRMGGGDGWVLVSQFMVELQGVKGEESEEDAAKVLHFNPRLKGDWSGRPVIEMNTCYRMQWGASMRCDGMVAGGDEEEKVDGFNKCEKWVQSDNGSSKEAKTTSWLKRFIGRAKKPEIAWPFPFTEGKLFVLTLQAGIEGYHIYVGGLHVTSFPYRPGFTLEDATSLVIKGNVDVHSVYATSLPKSHPSYFIQKVLEMSDKWKSPPLPKGHVYLFIGILSATNHFAERMAVRKSWMQYPDIKSSYVVTRFFVALGSIKEVNVMMKKEAEYFGDIVILPFMDHYELVVLKSIAMCEYGINNITASYIMKCDDDTFIRLDVVLRVLKRFASRKSLYMGNLNLFHRPLRTGKWAVTYEEWPEDIYPPYANGPGYIISNDIASFIASKHANHSLKMFKMEDVSMGMWVEEFNASSSPVKYLHSWKFCQYGCIENYYTAHYQSPRQMICLWDKLSRGQASAATADSRSEEKEPIYKIYTAMHASLSIFSEKENCYIIHLRAPQMPPDLFCSTH